VTHHLSPDLSQVFGIERDLNVILRVVRAIRNTHIPVNKLPPEILSRVLKHQDRKSDLVVATHVCQYWRSTLTSSPSLWSRVDVLSKHDLDRALTYFERSKSTPTDVRVDMWPSEHLEKLKYLTPHIARTRSLTIDGSRTGILATSLLFQDPTPSLQQLEMHCRGSFVPLPPTFFGQQAPPLRSVTLHGICPALESPFPFPHLTELCLGLPLDTGPFPITSFFRLCSNCPRLRKISVDVFSGTFRDVALGQIIPLESLVELEFTCRTAHPVLPCLKLPHLKRLRVLSYLQEGQVHKLADILPYDGHVLLAGVTKVFYHPANYSRELELSGGGVSLSLNLYSSETCTVPVDWFSDKPSIPFGQIEDLTVRGHSSAADIPINLFKNLRVLQIISWDAQLHGELFHLLHPGAGIPCPTLRETQCICFESLDLLIDLAKARLQAGYRLGLVRLGTSSESYADKEAELRGLVGEVLIQVADI
jgi:hypothetical protein